MDQKIKDILDEVGKVIRGKDEQIQMVLTAILAKGHILIEDIPGVGKTTMAVCFSRAMELTERRLQFTPDVLPSDVVGFNMLDADGEMQYKPGAILCNILLADEINRTSTKTQSALLEVMEEGQVTVDGVTRQLPNPFVVVATQNPVGSAGTQMLPESQLDRFMICLSMGYPEHQDAVDILKNNGAKSLSGIQAVVTLAEWKKLQNMAEESYVSEEMYDYIVRLTENTRKHPMVRLGASPRASLALLRMAKAMGVMKGRDYVTPENVMDIYQEVLAHRIKLNMQAKAQGLEVSDILKQVFEGTKVVCVE